MSNDVLRDTAVKYRLEDVKGAATDVGQVAKILAQLESGNTVTAVQLIFLGRRELTALKRLALGEITFSDYLPFAEQEQAARIVAAAEAERQESERAESERRAVEQQREAEHRVRMSDPFYRAKVRETELKEKYGLNEYVDPADYPKLMGLVRVIDKGKRITPEEFSWLSTQGGENYDHYLTPELEAGYYVAEFKRTGDPWQAVNASSLFRKCERPEHAERLLSGIEMSRVQGAKLKSAFFTTHGGAKRDLGDLVAAFELGNKAHALTPRDYHPCTLLGAVCYERGDYELGKKWYDKAVERGFKEADVDGELQSIFRRLGPKMRDAMRDQLLRLDPERYKWAASTVKPARQSGRETVARGSRGIGGADGTAKKK